jgi:two-component system, chemotaxis family, protein-glutamate methylesterase/glutaminase
LARLLGAALHMGHRLRDDRRNIIVVGGSSGALPALEFISDLSPNFPAAIFIVLHVAPQGPSLLPNIIRGYSPLPVEHAHDGEAIEAGRIYVAPPDHHLILTRGLVRVVRGPKENRHRPSVDVMFRSAAEAYGPRVTAVVLSGLLDDGSAGLNAVRSRGGVAVIQDPKDAQFPDMPRNALDAAGADYCVARSDIATVLTKMATEEPAKKQMEAVSEARRRTSTAEVYMDNFQQEQKHGKPSVFGCPDCGGVLWEIDDDKMLRFRCRVGHGLTAQSLLSAQSETLEEALWSALRALEEKAELSRRLMEHAVDRNYVSAEKIFEQQAKKSEEQAAVIRQLLTTKESETAEKLNLS